MTPAAAPGTWTVDGLLRHRPDGPGRVAYLPLEPSPQRDEAGRAAAGLLQAGGVAFLQLGAQWDPPAATLEALRARLAAADPDAGPPALGPPAGLAVGAAQLCAGETVLQVVGTSHVPPWSALFAVAPGPTERAEATAALRGEPGHLSVRFTAVLDDAPLVLEADVAGWVAPATAATPAPYEHVVTTDAIADLGRFDAPHPPTEGTPPC